MATILVLMAKLGWLSCQPSESTFSTSAAGLAPVNGLIL